MVLRAFGCTAYDGLKVLIHATSHDGENSRALSEFARLFESVSVDATAFLMSAWRGDVNLLELNKPEYRRCTEDGRRHSAASATSVHPAIERTIEALARIGTRQAG